MSRYHGNPDTCPECGLSYGEFRSGLSYRDVFGFLMDNSEDPADWRYKRRGTVLGHWHQIKKEWWDKHLDDCYLQAAHRNNGSRL